MQYDLWLLKTEISNWDVFVYYNEDFGALIGHLGRITSFQTVGYRNGSICRFNNVRVKVK